MPILHTFKQTVLELGRGEAKTKAKPLTIGGESLDRSAAGMDSRSGERAVIFWLLSDSALFLVVGTDDSDTAYRVPFEAVTEIRLDYDETAGFLPWYVRIAVDPGDAGEITRLESGHVPGQPLVAPPPAVLDVDDRARFTRGETVPLTGFGAFPKRFRDAITRRMEMAGGSVLITGAEAADHSTLAGKRKGSQTR